jgi:hypothetical protein
MAEYIFLMHDDSAAYDESAWAPYLDRLEQSGSFEGGSAIGDGTCTRKCGTAPSITAHLTGYIRVTAKSIDHAKALLAGNPHFEAGGTVEIRELPRTS